MVIAVGGVVWVIYTRGLATETAPLITALATLLGVLAAQAVYADVARSSQAHAQNLENQRAQDDALQGYFERMGELMLNHQLADPTADANADAKIARVSARALTLAITQRLDPKRKILALEFLYYSGLINTDQPLISFSGADLRDIVAAEVMSKAPLSEYLNNEPAWTNLYGGDVLSYLVGTVRAEELRELRSSRVDDAVFHSELSNANLSNALLTNAYLYLVDLGGCDLSEADLMNANLRAATL